MAGRRAALQPPAPRRSAIVLMAAVSIAGCGGGPAPARDAHGGVDLGPLVGSWIATVRGEGVWQGRWELHVQAGGLVLVQPDGELIVPGTVDAFASGALVLGPTLTCDSNVHGVRRGVYTYEVTTAGLRLRPGEEEDGCQDRRTVLTADTWAPGPRVAMPVRVDARPDASCGEPSPETPPAAAGTTSDAASGGPSPTPRTGLPLPWELVNQTAGFVLVVDPASDGSRTLVAAAAPGRTAVVDPQRGGRWEVVDLPGRCLARVSNAGRVTLRTGAAPVIEPRGQG